MATQQSVRVAPTFARVADKLFGVIDMRLPNWLYVQHDKRTNVVVHPVSLGAKAGAVDLYKLDAWDRLMRASLLRDPAFLNLHVDSGKYMRVAEMAAQVAEMQRLASRTAPAPSECLSTMRKYGLKMRWISAGKMMRDTA
jgi:hypothetical protein